MWKRVLTALFWGGGLVLWGGCQQHSGAAQDPSPLETPLEAEGEVPEVASKVQVPLPRGEKGISGKLASKKEVSPKGLPQGKKEKKAKEGTESSAQLRGQVRWKGNRPYFVFQWQLEKNLTPQFVLLNLYAAAPTPVLSVFDLRQRRALSLEKKYPHLSYYGPLAKELALPPGRYEAVLLCQHAGGTLVLRWEGKLPAAKEVGKRNL